MPGEKRHRPNGCVSSSGYSKLEPLMFIVFFLSLTIWKCPVRAFIDIQLLLLSLLMCCTFQYKLVQRINFIYQHYTYIFYFFIRFHCKKNHIRYVEKFPKKDD